MAQQTQSSAPAVPMQSPSQSSPDFNAETLQNFVSAVKKVQPIQQMTQQKMISTLKEEGFTIERFNEVAKIQQGKAAATAENKPTEEEKASFQTAAMEIGKMQKESQVKIQQIVQEEDLTMQTYQQIIMAYQQDPELQNQINSMMKEG